MDAGYVRECLRIHPDWPEKGVYFVDIMPLLADRTAFDYVIDGLMYGAGSVVSDAQKVVSIEARGFLFGEAIAKWLYKPHVLVRKRGKLPGETISMEFQKEYGRDTLEMQEGSIEPGEGVIMVDDLLALGGTAEAAANLVKKQGGNVLVATFPVNLSFLGGSKRLSDLGINVGSMINYESSDELKEQWEKQID